MSEPNEKILKRAAISEEEAAQVAGGRPLPVEVIYDESKKCTWCGLKGHSSDICEERNSIGECTFCGSSQHAARICPLKPVVADILQHMESIRNAGTI